MQELLSRIRIPLLVGIIVLAIIPIVLIVKNIFDENEDKSNKEDPALDEILSIADMDDDYHQDSRYDYKTYENMDNAGKVPENSNMQDNMHSNNHMQDNMHSNNYMQENMRQHNDNMNITQQENYKDDIGYVDREMINDNIQEMEDKSSMHQQYDNNDNREIMDYDNKSDIDNTKDNSKPSKKRTKNHKSSELAIEHILLDYGRQFHASEEDPLLITIAARTPKQAKYVLVRVFARRIDKKRNILSREIVFAMPKILVIDGRTQTQFYWAGKNIEGNFLTKGNYILYVEIEAMNEMDEVIERSGKYPTPKWKKYIELK